MKNTNIDKIKKRIVEMLIEEYGYCGEADSDNTAMLNSGNESDEFTITIKDKTL